MLYFRLPAQLEVSWPEANHVTNNEKRKSGKTIGEKFIDKTVFELVLLSRVQIKNSVEIHSKTQLPSLVCTVFDFNIGAKDSV